jgi:O-antigen ligase
MLFVLVMLLYFYFRLLFQVNRHAIYWLVICLVLTGLVEAVWGLRQLYGYEPSQHSLFRITGSFFNPGPYACYVAVISPMAFYYLLKYRTNYATKFHFRNFRIYILWGIATLTVVSSVLVLPATMSRASWLAATGGCTWVLFTFLTENKKMKAVIALNKKRCMLITSAIVILIIVGGVGMYHLKKDSANGRMLIWKNTIELIKQNPMGVGIGNFSGSYGHVQAVYFEAEHGTEDEKHVAGNPEYAFNEYLQLCAEQGILAFLLFTGIVGFSLYTGFKRKKVAPTASLIALLIAASASYPFSVLPFLITFVYLLAWIHEEAKEIAVPKSVSIAFTVCCFIIVSLCLYNRFPTYNAYKKWNNIQMFYNLGNQQDTAKEYRSLYPLLSDQIQFLFEYAQCLSKSEQYEDSNEVLEKAVQISCDPMLYNIMGKNYQGQKQYAEAEQCFLKASHIVPSRIYPHYLMALMYKEAGDTGKAKAVAQSVLSKEPKVPSTAVREMKSKMRKLINEN